jgi:hypothetical protein
MCVHGQVGPVVSSQHHHVGISFRWPGLGQKSEDSHCRGTGKVNSNNGGAPPIDSPQQRVSRARQGYTFSKVLPILVLYGKHTSTQTSVNFCKAYKNSCKGHIYIGIQHFVQRQGNTKRSWGGSGEQQIRQRYCRYELLHRGRASHAPH